jgi:hypothetical protein
MLPPTHSLLPSSSSVCLSLCLHCFSALSHLLTGSVRFKEELSLRENGGLSKGIVILSRIKKRHPLVSWADLIHMAGALAVELAGGPKIDMLYGRMDSPRESYQLRVSLLLSLSPALSLSSLSLSRSLSLSVSLCLSHFI